VLRMHLAKTATYRAWVVWQRTNVFSLSTVTFAFFNSLFCIAVQHVQWAGMEKIVLVLAVLNAWMVTYVTLSMVLALEAATLAMSPHNVMVVSF
jgi:hypothetical protein